MISIIRTAAIAALVGLGAAGVTTHAAQAGVLEVGHRGDGVRIGIGVGPQWGHGPKWGHRAQPRFCTDGRAIGKARAMGVRHARIGHANHRIVSVNGRKFGHRVSLTFSRAPNCPIVDW